MELCSFVCQYLHAMTWPEFLSTSFTSACSKGFRETSGQGFTSLDEPERQSNITRHPMYPDNCCFLSESQASFPTIEKLKLEHLSSPFILFDGIYGHMFQKGQSCNPYKKYILVWSCLLFHFILRALLL